MMEFDECVRGFIECHGLLRAGEGVVVGLSGGADSVALLAVLCQLGYRCVAVHCNYHLRGDESDRDERVAREVAETLGCDIVVEHCRPGGGNVEAVCRELRYGLYGRICAERGIGVIAVGHHLEDNVETFIYNSVRGGSSLKGLKGMLPKRGNVVRPLLSVTRDRIESYLAERGLPWIIDSSNRSDEYARNRVRNIVMPAMRQLRPDADTRIADTIARLQGDYLLLKDYIAELCDRYTTAEGAIDVGALASGHPHPAMSLYRILAACTDGGMSGRQVEDMLAEPVSAEAKIFTTARGVRYVLQGGILGRLDPEVGMRRFMLHEGLDGVIAAEIIAPEQFAPRRDARVIYLDADALPDGEPTVYRAPRPGDRIAPFGMSGTKLVADIMHNARLSANERRRTAVLELDGEVVWVVGLRASGRYAVTARTRRILRLQAL